jgi:hypothetical protein
MYTIVHHYLTVGDDGTPVVENESVTVHDPSEIADAVREMTDHPGGTSGTTVSMSVSLTQATSI